MHLKLHGWAVLALKGRRHEKQIPPLRETGSGGSELKGLRGPRPVG